MPSRKVYFIIIIVILMLGFTYYNIEKREAIKNCKFKLTDVRVRSVGLTSADLELVVTIYNPRSITATLSRADFEVYGNGALLGTGKITNSVDILPHTSRSVIAFYI